VTGYLVELVVVLVLVGIVAAVARGARSNPAHATLGPGWRRPGGSHRGCCLDEPCGPECGRRQQAAYTLRYAQGAEDALRHPDAVRALVLTAAEDLQVGQASRLALPADRTGGKS